MIFRCLILATAAAPKKEKIAPLSPSPPPTKNKGRRKKKRNHALGKPYKPSPPKFDSNSVCQYFLVLPHER
jgi:hypothetical protein